MVASAVFSSSCINGQPCRLSRRAVTVFKTAQEFCLAAFLVVTSSNQYDRMVRFVEQRDGCSGCIAWRGILEFLQLRSLGESEESFRPFKFRGEGFYPLEKADKVQWAGQTNRRGNWMIRCPSVRRG